MGTPKAIQFGAGSIGRGFIGALLTASGYHVVFADVNQELIDTINEEGEYKVHILAPRGEVYEQSSGSEISGCLSNSSDIIKEIEEADIITTAVGPDILKFIAPTIAKGILARQQKGVKKPLNIIACENRVHASSILRDLVLQNLPDEESRKYCDEYVGFPDCSVDRIVPPPSQITPPQSEDENESRPSSRRSSLDVNAEDFYEWIVDRNALKGDPPFPIPIMGMKLTDNLEAYVERKLFTLNTGHAIAGYLGYLKGYKTIDESISDEDIEKNVHNAMLESGKALCRKHGFSWEDHLQYIETIISRFRNPHLKDEVSRVCREPLRKLGRNDRLIGPANLCKKFGLPNVHLCRGIAAVLRYDNPNDPQSVELIGRVKKDGVRKTIMDITGWKESDQEVYWVEWNYEDLEKYLGVGR